MMRSLHQACQAVREWTGWKPSARPTESARMDTRVIAAKSTSASSAPGTDHRAARSTSSPEVPASRAPHATSASPAASATSGIAPNTTAETW